MKKIVLIAFSFFFALSAQASYKDGTYEGSGRGNRDQIKVQVIVKGGKLSSVKVLSHHETEAIIQAPIDMMLPEIVKNNGTNGVDTVAGATNSSKGILAAVSDALSKAR